MPDSTTFVLRSTRVVCDGAVAPASVVVDGGVIRAVAPYDARVAGAELVDAGDAVVMAGLVDTHVHVNDPGRAEWEGFETATRAAAAGGVTTLVDMPLNSVPPTTTVDGLRAKLAAAEGRLYVDVGFWGGVVPGNTYELGALWDAGVLGFKCFLSPSGVPEFESVGEPELRRAMPVLARLGAPLLVHAESPSRLTVPAGDPRAYGGYLRSRPPAAEAEAVQLLIALCREYGTRVHVVHLATGEALAPLRAARAAGLPISVETCPHYLHFAAEEIGYGETTLKCAPPIRERAERERLWAAVAEGTIDLVATDHSPCPPELKARATGDFGAAWGGIASLQLALPVVWTGARARGHTPAALASWMGAAPARLAGLHPRKGELTAGADADLVVWRPDAEFTVAAGALQQRHRRSVYEGARLAGVVEATYLRGLRAGAEPRGRPLLRGRS